MATTQAQLDTAIQSLGTAVTGEDSLIAQILQKVTDLLAAIQANPTGDFTTETTAINSMASDISTQAASIQAALVAAGATAPTTPPATPPTVTPPAAS